MAIPKCPVVIKVNSPAKLTAVKTGDALHRHTCASLRDRWVACGHWSRKRVHMQSDVLIVGAGPAGLCLSLALAAGLLDESPCGPSPLRHVRLAIGALRPRLGRGGART